MKKIILLFSLAAVITIGSAFRSAEGKKYFTRTGHIWFYSHTPIEDIEAHNYKVSSVLDASTGKMEFAVLMTAFQFEKALMQEHFNENYVESEKYPKAQFKGQITNVSKVNWAKDGTYPVKVSGELTIKDKTNPVSTDGTVEIKGESVNASSKFKIKLADYNVEVPKMVRNKISEELEITVEMNYSELKR